MKRRTAKDNEIAEENVTKGHRPNKIASYWKTKFSRPWKKNQTNKQTKQAALCVTTVDKNIGETNNPEKRGSNNMRPQVENDVTMQVLISSVIVLLLYAIIGCVIKLSIMFGMIVFLVRMYDGVNKEERNRILKLLILPERGNVLTQKIKRSFMKMVQ